LTARHASTNRACFAYAPYITEVRGYEASLKKGELGIQGPKGSEEKASVQGPDYLTFDPESATVFAYDAKYRSPGGSYPSKIPDETLKRWLPQIKGAIDTLSAGPLKDRATEAYNSGRVQGRIYRNQ